MYSVFFLCLPNGPFASLKKKHILYWIPDIIKSGYRQAAKRRVDGLEDYLL